MELLIFDLFLVDRNVRQIAETQDEEYKMLNQRKKLLKEALQII